MGKIIVIGSSNTDLIAQVKEFPKAGETIRGDAYLQAMGGKGANQAIAAHRLGGEVKFVSSLGKDPNGINAMDYYKKERLDASLSLITDKATSGVAMIWVDSKGENSIVIIAGANELLSPEYIRSIEQEILKADMVVMQMEIPYDTVKTVCDIAHRNGIKVFLNVAPARVLDADMIRKTDILVVNETEAETIAGEIIEHIGEEGIVDRLLKMGANTVILTLGKRGSFMKNKQMQLHVPAFNVDAVDTTAAGDTFCGALAARLSCGAEWREALEFATAAAAICVTRMGAQPSIPATDEVLDFIAKQKESFPKTINKGDL